jgi:hypothetical protein
MKRKSIEHVAVIVPCRSEQSPARTDEGNVETPEEFLREAEECERLAGLARSIATRQLMAVAAFQWRKLAEKAADRSKARSSFVWPGR